MSYDENCVRFFRSTPALSMMAGFASFFSLLVPTCYFLVPAGKKSRNAGSNRDLAQGAYDQRLGEYNGHKEQLRIANQKIVDLDCAIPGYQGINEAAIAFMLSIKNSNETPLERLNSKYLLNFSPDQTTTSQSVIGRSWVESERVYGTFYSCSYRYKCTNNQSCCYVTDWRWVDKTHFYNEITDTTEVRKNIVIGGGKTIGPFNCGYFSRGIWFSSPSTYLTHETPRIPGGDRRAGSVYIKVERDFGSQVPLRYTLDGSTVNSQIMVPREASQSAAADSLSTNLFQFLVAAVAAFNATGMNYPALQATIRNSLPSLESALAASNETLVEQTGRLADAQAVFSTADTEYYDALALWLPMLFLIPPALTFITILAATLIKKQCCDEENSNTEMHSMG